MSNPLPDWMDQKIWPQIYGMLLNDAYFKLMCRARELTGAFNGPIAELIQTGYLSFQTVAIRRLCDNGRTVISLRRVLKEAKSNNLAPVDQINGLSDKLNSCEPVVDLVNDHVAHTANPARNPNMSGSTCPWADLFKAQEAICRVAVSVQRDILHRKVVSEIMPVDVVQATLARALQTWPFYGVPKNPAGWIMRASRNVALDVVRREKVLRDKEGEIARLIEEGLTASDEMFSKPKSVDIAKLECKKAEKAAKR